MFGTSISKSVNSIRDNFSNGSVGDFLQSHLEQNSNLSFVTAYFTIYAYEKLKGQLDEINSLRLLFGEPRFLKSVSSSTEAKSYMIENGQLVMPVENRLTQKMLAKQCCNWIKDKVEIKSMVRPDFLHGKLYHIQKQNGLEEAVAGSSNFTVNGLGLGSRPNIELNLVVNDSRDLSDLKDWFDRLWENGMPHVEVEDVKAEVLKYLEQLYVENDPEFIYFKTLYHIFDNFIKEQSKGGLLNEKIGFFDTEVWNCLYDFQRDGTKGAINKILRHNGCIIADSVGLGKTFEALAVIKYFELLNFNVLVLCPKKLSSNWTIYQANQNHVLNPFVKDRFRYTVMYHTDLCRITGKSDANGIDLENFKWGNFDLVVIDESHNFRGNPMDKLKDDGTTRMNRPKWLMEKIIRSGAKTKVLLLSATPVNNNLKDLRNQLSLITEGVNDALFETTGIKDIALSLKNAQTQFTNWADKRNTDRTVRQLIEKLDSSFFKLLDELTIARSRKHIKNSYNVNAIGNFPIREKPLSVYPNIDTTDWFPTYDKINKRILAYKLSVFNPSKYVLEGKEGKYGILTKEQKEKLKKEKEERKKKRKKGETQELKPAETNFDQSERENFLIGMMKVNFLKRLESSIESFEISMKRTIEKITALEKNILDFKEKKADKDKEIDASDCLPDDSEHEENEDDMEGWEIGKKLKFKLKDLDLDKWLSDLQDDKEALNDLYINAQAVTPARDAKLADLRSLIENKLHTPLNTGNKKVIVFTAFADTAQYLFDNLKDWAKNSLKLNIALVAGGYTQTTYGKNDFLSILTNFSPVSKNRAKIKSMPQDAEIDILIATDCISEGQNLQDCDFLVNYDIHWNPVRIIQRFGRIDRLGSINEKIQLVNFWPTKDLDNYINLKERVEARMALVDVTATADDNLLATDQIEELIEEDLKYRNQQLKKLRDEVLDLEDMNESVSITDFTLDDFRIDLTHYLDENKEKLEKAPLGLYGVVPALSGPNERFADINLFSASQRDIVKPGIIYCLRQEGDTEGNETVNPLQPYFLVYIRNDGTVRFNYTSAKQILEMYRLLCQGHKQPYLELCEIFNEETKQGKDMAEYSQLLVQALAEISRVFKKRNFQKLTTDRGAQLIPFTKQVNDSSNFELITWLIIK